MKNKRRVRGNDLTRPVPPRSGLVQLLSEPRRRRQRPVGLSPAVALTIKSRSVEISASYPNLSTFSFPIKAARAAGYLPNERRLRQTLATLRRIELDDAS